MRLERNLLVKPNNHTIPMDTLFKTEFDAMQLRAFTINVDNGWWNNRDLLMQSNIPSATQNVALACLNLVNSEVAEASEAVRRHPITDWGKHRIKDTLVRELAGTVIRCMDFAQRFSLPLSEAIIEELENNKTRGQLHGGKSA